VSNSAAAIDRLRAIAARLGDDSDAQWFAACLAEYESGAPHGVTMEHAFGLACSSPGERPWWVIEAQSRRDELVRCIDAQRFGSLPVRTAARDFWAALSRYESSAWRRDRSYTSPTDRSHADLFRLLKLDAPLSEATIRRVLAGSRNTPIREPAAARR
jgi:hypothetical protein